MTNLIIERQKSSREMLEGASKTNGTVIKEGSLDDDLVVLFNASGSDKVAQTMILTWQIVRNTSLTQMSVTGILGLLAKAISIQTAPKATES